MRESESKYTNTIRFIKLIKSCYGHWGSSGFPSGCPPTDLMISSKQCPKKWLSAASLIIKLCIVGSDGGSQNFHIG